MKGLRATLGSLINLCCNGKLDVESFVHGMEETKKSFVHPTTQRDEFSQSLVEQIWIKQAELNQKEPKSLESFRTAMVPIITQLLQKQIITVEDCFLILESDMMAACRITKLDEASFKRMASQANTQKHYTQIKFNLLREENEGFSKLIVEISQPNISLTNVKLVI